MKNKIFRRIQKKYLMLAMLVIGIILLIISGTVNNLIVIVSLMTAGIYLILISLIILTK